MKRLVILSIITLLILLLPPFFIGSQVETEFRNQVTRAGAHPAYTLTIRDYQKGWFHSVALLDISFELPESDQAPSTTMTVTLIQDMQHGPFLWTADSFAFGLMDTTIDFEAPQALRNSFSDKSNWNPDTLIVTGRTSFDLSTQFKFSLESFSISNQRDVIEVLPAEGQLTFNQQGQIKGQASWQGMNVVEAGERQLQLKELKVILNQQLVSGDLFAANSMFDGNITANIASLVMAENNPIAKVALQQITLEGDSTVQDEVTNLKVALKVKTIDALAQRFTDFDYDLTLDNLDTETLKALNQTLSEAQMQNHEDPSVVSAKIQSMLPKLIERGPLLKINKLAMMTNDGEIDSQMRVSIDQSIYDPENPLTMMVAIDAKADGYAPEALLNGFGLAPTIEQLLHQNLLVRDQQNLKFSFVFKNGQALLNGSPIPFSAF